MCLESSGFNVTCRGSGLKHSYGHLAFSRMPSSNVAVATRAFVAVLLLLARRYKLVLEVNRDASVEQLTRAYRKVVLKAHPDKGGKKEDAQTLQAARETWDKARKGSEAKGGRPSAGSDAGVLVCQNSRKVYRVTAQVVLLTYQGFSDLAQWHRFVVFVRGLLKKWTVHRWGTTLEACETEGLHTHLVLQFTKEVDRTARSFAFEGLTPNVRKGDYLGEGPRSTVGVSGRPTLLPTAHRPTDRPTARPPARPADLPIARPSDRSPDRPSDRPTARLTG